MSQSRVRFNITADTKRFQRQVKRVLWRVWWSDWRNKVAAIVVTFMLCVALYSIGAVLWTLRVVVWTS